MAKRPPTSTPTEDAGSIADLLKAVAQTPEASAARLPLGLVLHDTHRLTRFIGEGGMGAVYEAVHVRLHKKRFAIKVLKTMRTGTQTPYARFRREAEIATELGHPNIVDVLDFYETEEGRPCMVMELLEGEDLEARLQRVRRLTPVQLAPILRQVGGALQEAHDHNVVHRDLKPANIFLARAEDGSGDELVKLLDFGISKIRDDGAGITSNVAMIGTPQYMSPEQGIGQAGDVDHTSDIFALGIICHQALCGALPFDAPTIPGVLYKICHEDPPSITELVEELPAAVAPVLARALAKTRVERYQRVETFVEQLCDVLEAPTDVVITAPWPQRDAAVTAPWPPAAYAVTTLPEPAADEVSGPPARARSTADSLGGRQLARPPTPLPTPLAQPVSQPLAQPVSQPVAQPLPQQMSHPVATPPRRRWPLLLVLIPLVGALAAGGILLAGRSGSPPDAAGTLAETAPAPDLAVRPDGHVADSAPGDAAADSAPADGATTAPAKAQDRHQRPKARAPRQGSPGGQGATRRQNHGKVNDAGAAPIRPPETKQHKKKIYDEL